MAIPLVSVIIPTYNRAAYIARAIISVQNQTFRDLEIIVVDDGSVDNTSDIVAELATIDHRVRYIANAVNKGAQVARNTGVQAALGKWIAFQDSDDEWLPNSLGLRLLEAEHRNVKVVHSECYIEYLISNQRSLFGIHPLSGNIYRAILFTPGPVFPALLIQMSALKQISFLDDAIVSHQEWDTCIRLAKEYEFGFVESPTFIYYRRPANTISSSPFLAARGYEQIVEKHKNEIKSKVGRKALARHFGIIAWLYSKDTEGEHKSLIRKYSGLAIRSYPSPKHLYHLLNYLLSDQMQFAKSIFSLHF
jgi:glycosyltransferase involved in cell wall biosynthesis